MRRVAWVMVLVMAAVAAPYGSAGRAAAQPTTVPFPDFDHDGFGDLAVGVPGEDVGTAVDAGAVHVLYGSAGGLVSDGRVLAQGAGGVPGASEGSDRFGTAMAALRLNTDVYDDLVIGVPGEDLGTAADAGAVAILFGSATGLGGGGGRLLTQGNPEAGDRFGFSLTGGEVTALDQLVVGAPGEDVGAAADAGAVSLITNPGSSPSEQLLYQGAAGMVGTPERSDAFGSALVAGDFNDSDGQDSLAVGVPGEDVGTVPDAGVVDVRYAPGFGQPAGPRQLTQDRPEAGDLFGAALQTGSFDPADGHTDLAVGAPGETVGGSSGAGAVSIVLADASGFAAGGQLFHQGVDGVPGVAEAGDGFGTALAAGGFGDDGAGLAVGAPGEDIGGAADAGVVDLLGSSGSGLGGGSRRQLTQADAAGAVEPGDGFGEALSVFTLESDVLPDLAVGAPGETVGGRSGAGAGSVLFDVGTGGSGASQFFYQGVAGVGGAPEAGDAFGWAMG